MEKSCDYDSLLSGKSSSGQVIEYAENVLLLRMKQLTNPLSLHFGWMAHWLLTLPDSKYGGEGRIKQNVWASASGCLLEPPLTSAPVKLNLNLWGWGLGIPGICFCFFFSSSLGYCAARVENLQGMYMESGNSVWIILFAGQQRRCWQKE